jgi:hypothetical protein
MCRRHRLRFTKNEEHPLRMSQPRWFKAALRKGKTERSLLIR